MLTIATIKGMFHGHHHMLHPADAVFLVLAILFIVMPLVFFLYTFFMNILTMLRDMSGV